MRIRVLRLVRLTALSVVLGGLGVITSAAPQVTSTVSFLGVAAGDPTSTAVTLWTRAVDSNLPGQAVPVVLQISADSSFQSGVISQALLTTTQAAGDNTLKVSISNLTPGTQYFYRYTGAAGAISIVGTFKTAPDAAAYYPLRFAFSGDYDGLMRPHSLSSVFPTQNLDFYVSLGDIIYETASNLPSGSHNGASWLNSPAATLSGPSSTLNGDPNNSSVAGTCPNPPTSGTPPVVVPFATQLQLKSDYEKKYRENLLPVNTGGQNGLQPLYASQGIYATWDNHELGNRQYINGGAPAGGPVGGPGPLFNDMPTGCGVDSRANVGGNVNNVNDTNTSSSSYINRSTGFQTLRNVFLEYQPIANRGPVSAPADPRTDGTTQLYTAQQWGRNAIYIHTDSRSYRDLRIKTANGSLDDTGQRADNTNRTFLGATQLAWVEQTLLNAHNAGTTWKFVTVSDPIDQLGPIGGALTLSNLPDFGPGSTYAAVSSDGGKSWMGGYRAERNALLKFIADNHIANVVFIATDDHQNRVNELAYSPSGQTSNQSTYVKVPYTFSIVAGPLGATGPDLITNHTFSMAKQLADSIATAQLASNVEPLGLIGYPGLHDLIREGDPTAATAPQPVDFYSPDTFNFVILEVSPDGSTLTVKSIGMDSTAQNSGIEYANGPQARNLFSFQIDAVPFTARSGFVFNRRSNLVTQQVTLTNNSGSTLNGPIHLVLTGLSSNTTLSNATGATISNFPGSPFITVQPGSLAPGASINVVLNFTRPASGGITYGTQLVNGTITP